MAHRVLIAAVGLIVAAGLVGCKGKKKSQQGTKQQAIVAGKGAPAWEKGEGAVPTGEGRTELHKLAVQYQQLKKLASRRKLPYKSVESLGWAISGRSRDLVDAYELSTREKVTAEESKASELKAKERPEDKWLRWPESIRDLDRVAINAKAVALAAGTWDEERLRQKLRDLDKVAHRCLPSPESQSVSGVQPGATAAGTTGSGNK